MFTPNSSTPIIHRYRGTSLSIADDHVAVADSTGMKKDWVKVGDLGWEAFRYKLAGYRLNAWYEDWDYRYVYWQSGLTPVLTANGWDHKEMFRSLHRIVVELERGTGDMLHVSKLSECASLVEKCYLGADYWSMGKQFRNKLRKSYKKAETL